MRYDTKKIDPAMQLIKIPEMILNGINIYIYVLDMCILLYFHCGI